MKRLLSLCFVFLMTLSLVACSPKNYDKSTLVIGEKGQLTEAVIEEFDEKQLSSDDLKTYIDEEIKAYNDNTGEERIKIESFKVEDNIAKVYLKYDSVKDYAAFNNVTLYAGTVKEALIADKNFDDVTFKSVKEKKQSGSYKYEDIEDEVSELNVCIVDECTNVELPGEIVYISNENVKVTDDKNVTIKENIQSESSNDETPDESNKDENKTNISDEILSLKLKSPVIIFYK
ncbi:hypothetical protein SAMN05216249_101121 [Acetitomaculum ruminis DSM 5522]|uniref:Lipoprotein n=1 Tax=Acetitomaculum ruminis DSM 5522 TaxID=1120918 RepID=A0A1I0V2C8_9FIRM|nr:hypothetical protein [Acetitomaculum ruminis]SFA70475.1 hypothetical protein SAMN05216249_101121 [Acetitomaculum ruminis DSM 5522]